MHEANKNSKFDKVTAETLNRTRFDDPFAQANYYSMPDGVALIARTISLQVLSSAADLGHQSQSSKCHSSEEKGKKDKGEDTRLLTIRSCCSCI